MQDSISPRSGGRPTRLRQLAGVLLCLSTLAAGARAERLPVKVYTSADGLGSSAAFNIVRDPQGFIWLCSRDGLIRFDGYRFITYRVGSDDADPAVFGLLPARGTGYWIDLNRGDDYRFVAKDDGVPLAPARQQTAANDPRIPLDVTPVTDSPMPTFQDAAGELWTADEKGIYVLREADGRFVREAVELRLPGNPEQGLRRFVFRQGRDGSVWIGTNWGLVRRLPDGRQLHYGLRPGAAGDPVYLLDEDADGRVWVAHADEIIVLKAEPLAELSGLGQFGERRAAVRAGVVGEDGRAQMPVRPGEAAAFAFDAVMKVSDERVEGHGRKAETYGLISARDGKVWITSSRGLVLFDGERFQLFDHTRGLGQTGLGSLVEDREGNIWITSYSGLLRLNPNGLTSYDEADGLAQVRVHSIYEDTRGEINVVTGDWNVSRLRDGRFVTGRPRLREKEAWLWHSNVGFLDSRGDWWVITRQRLYRFAGVGRAEELTGREPTAVYTSTEDLAGESNYRIFEDARGDIWVSTFPDAKTQGLARWERATGKFQRYYQADGLPAGSSASAFGIDRAGNTWVGFVGGELLRYRDGRFDTVEGVGDQRLGLISGIYSDSRGRLWIASSIGGLTRVDDPGAERPAFKRYTIADGLTSNNVRCITEDLFGNIYVGTVRGVNRLSPETGRVKYYGTGDGLASDFVSAAHRDRTGAIWFGTFSGLSKLVPRPDPPLSPPPILISGLRVAGEDYSVSPLGQAEALVPALDASRNHVQVEFFSVGAGGEAAARYQYMLEGADRDWGPPTASRSVTFANLSPGAYRLLVRAVNAEGVASLRPASVSFQILRPVWLRWWFLTLSALLLAALAYALYRYRVARLVELERVRTRIATDLHDDIGASLSRVAMLSEVVKLQIDGAGGQAAALLNEIADSARGLVDSMSDIVWSIDPRRDDVHNVVVRVRQFASDVLEAREIRWDFSVSPEVEGLRLHPEQRRHLYLIFKEAVNNVVRHAGHVSSVALSLRVSGGQLVGEVRDDGRGFTPKPPGERQSNGRGGNGLPNMRARAEQLGGRLEVESAPGVGTRLLLRLPLK